MKKSLLIAVCLILIAGVTGCVRTYTITKDRVDLEVAGNQGVIYGTPPAPHKVESATRDIYAIDIELPTGEEIRKSFTKTPRNSQSGAQDKDVSGNAGMVLQEKK